MLSGKVFSIYFSEIWNRGNTTTGLNEMQFAVWDLVNIQLA